MIKPIKLLGYATLALSLFATGAQAKTINKTFEVGDNGLLKLETNSGSLRIDSHNEDLVKVTVQIDGKDEDLMNVSFDKSGNDVTIIGQRERNYNGWGRGNRLKVSYKITVPEHYNLDVDTSGGSIKISNLVGTVNAHTSGGSISLGRIDGLVDINTSGGSINVDEVTGTIKAHTSGGSVNAKISQQPSGDSKLTTSGGSITVYLANDIAVDLTARTSGGRVHSDFDVNGEKRKKSIRGAINGGGPKLVLKTSGGSVRIKEM
jgi:DUF4097 and DUF4098 domain-containing protein YvlB